MKKVELTGEALSMITSEGGYYMFNMFSISRVEINYEIFVHYKDSKFYYFFNDCENFTGQLTYAIDDRLSKIYYSFEDIFSALKEMCAFYLFRFEFVNYDCAEYVAQQLVDVLNSKKYVYSGISPVLGFMSQIFRGPLINWILKFDDTTNRWSIKEDESTADSFCNVSSWFDWDNDIDGIPLTPEEHAAMIARIEREIEREYGPFEQEENSLSI